MRNIVIGFSKSRKKYPIGSWVIRAYQRSDFSHVYIRLPLAGDKFPSDKILHASEGKVQNMSGTQFDRRHIVVQEFQISVPNWMYAELVKEMHEVSGDDYSIMQNVGIVLVEILKLIGITIKNPWIKGWNCSEFVAVILKQVLDEEFVEFDVNLITPKDIYLILQDLSTSGQILRLNNYK